MTDTSTSSLEHMPEGRWTFDEQVTHRFDDMLERSIPDYPRMRDTVLDVGTPLVQRDTWIVDLGCSRGGAIVPFLNRFGVYNKFLGVEVSQPMRQAAAERFHGWPNVTITDLDLRTDYPKHPASLTLSVLTLQFTPIEYRQRILRSAFKATRPGGALILVEKVLGATADLDALLVDRYHQHKQRAGYTRDAIDRKAYALEGVLVPVTAAMNEQLLAGAGFTQVDCIWRRLNFAAWVAVRDT